MKSSKEMYESLLTRREEYVNARRKRVKGIALISVCMAVFALVGVGTWHIIRSDMKKGSAEKTALTENAPQATAQQQGDVSTADKLPVNATVEADMLGMIIVGGREYCEIGWGNPEGYTKKEFIGMASDFDGNYKTHDMSYDGEVYTVNETDDILLLYTDNDGIVVLRDVNSETTFIDQIGTIIKDGREYRQIFSDNTDGYTKKDCIGRASEFDGTYSGTPDVDGDVYTVNETESVLVIHLDNGGTVYLKCAE